MLVIGKQDSLVAEFLLEDPILSDQVTDQLLLLSISMACQDDEVEMPGLENEVHWFDSLGDQAHFSSPSC